MTVIKLDGTSNQRVIPVDRELALRGRVPALVVRLADFLRQSEAPRFARVLAFLAQRNISAQRLNEAMGSARFHDGLHQLVTSEFSYMSSFGVFNGLMALLLQQFGGASQRLSPATASLPLFAAPLTAMFTNRQLRQREVMPKWTRPVEAGPDGKVIAAGTLAELRSMLAERDLLAGHAGEDGQVGRPEPGSVGNALPGIEIRAIFEEMIRTVFRDVKGVIDVRRM